MNIFIEFSERVAIFQLYLCSMNIKAWLSAFRLRTLPLSLSGIILGTAIAAAQGYFLPIVFGLALTTTVLFQIVSNLANDLGDSQKGTDNEHRVGPKRTVQSGAISMNQMKNAVILFSILSLASASLLIFYSAQNLSLQSIYFYLLLALLCVAAAIMYTVGKMAYGYNGFGDAMVFVFFGLVSVLGVFTLYTNYIDPLNFLPGTAIGFLSTAVLNLNNMRDIENDRASKKNTLVVVIGPKKAKIYHYFLISGAFFSLAMFLFISQNHLAMIGLLPFILLFNHLIKVKNISEAKEFDPELKKVALSTFAIALLTSVGLFL
ncbi:MAG: 1,4-dihydroxy-2-naphthoate octaprenyltransferase [Bacteroidota bacterium]